MMSLQSINRLSDGAQSTTLQPISMVILASLVDQVVKNPPQCGRVGLIPGLGRPPGGGHDNPLQRSYLENPHGQSSLEGYGAWGHKELDTTEQT